MTGKSIKYWEVLLDLDWAEDDNVEFKSARGGLPKSLWETYSAMANSQGGVILLGVEDDGRVSGVKDPRKLKKAFWDTVNNRGKVNANLCTRDDIATAQHPRGTILAIRVPRAPSSVRPVFLGQNPLTGTYRRDYEGDYRCTEQEVSRMLSDRPDDSADSRILEGFGIKDIDLPSLRQYRNRFRSHSPEHPWANEDDMGLLTKLGGWRRERGANIDGLTLAGLLMFGRHETLLEGAPAYHVDYRERLSEDPRERWSDRLTVDGMWEPNLFQFYSRVIVRLFADLKTPFRLDEDLFRKEETEVHEAVREALVNALIHADYHGQGGIVVEKRRNALEFSNPGSLLVSIEQVMGGNVSQCRNKTLQTMFMLIGAAEKAGSGVDKILRGWASQHWRLPLIREQFRPDRVLWQLPMVSLIPDESLTRLGELFRGRFEQFDQNEVQALVTADIEGSVDNARMRQVSNLHAADVTLLLQGLVAQGALAQEGRGRWSRYRLPGAVAPNIRGGHSEHKGVDSEHKSGHSEHKGGHSEHKGAVTPNIKGGHSEHKGGRFEYKAVRSEHNEQLNAISAPARNKRRLRPEEMERIILDLCRDRWLTRNELAELLDRHPDGLRQRFLNPMVGHGLLNLRYPDKPNRTDQAYSSVRADRVREPAAPWRTGFQAILKKGRDKQGRRP